MSFMPPKHIRQGGEQITEQDTVGQSNVLPQRYEKLFRSLIWRFRHTTRSLIMEYKGRNSFDAAFKFNVIKIAITEGTRAAASKPGKTFHKFIQAKRRIQLDGPVNIV